MHDSCRRSLKHNFDLFFQNSCLSQQLPDLPVLGSLLAGLSLPVQENDSQATPSDSSNAFLWSWPPWTAAQLAPIIQGTSKTASLADVTGRLQELDEMSKRRVDVLQHFTVSVNGWIAWSKFLNFRKNWIVCFLADLPRHWSQHRYLFQFNDVKFSFAASCFCNTWELRNFSVIETHQSQNSVTVVAFTERITTIDASFSWNLQKCGTFVNDASSETRSSVSELQCSLSLCAMCSRPT